MLDSQLRLLTAAKTLFLSRGYTATTVDAICEAAGLTKGSFYHFYESKEALALAVLEWSFQTTGEILADGPHTGVDDPIERVFAYLDHFATCSPELWKRGCLLGVFAIELVETSPRMQAAVSDAFHAVSAHMAEILAPVLEVCPKGRLGSPMELADEFFGALEGAIILARAHRQPERIERAIRLFAARLREEVPAAA